MAKRNPGRDKSGHVDPLYTRRKRYEAVLRPVGLWELFVAMPRSVQEQFLRLKFPDPVIEFDESYPDDAAHRSLRRAIEDNFRKATIELDGLTVTVRDFFAVIGGVYHAAASCIIDKQTPATVVRFLIEARRIMEALYEPNIGEAWGPVHQAVVCPLIARSRLDTRLMTTRVKQEFQENGKYVVRLTISSMPAESRQLTLDGGQRPMWRVGTNNEWDVVRWVSWDGATVGHPEWAGEIPVYIQSHALRNLRQRVNLARVNPYLEYWLYMSLKNPTIVERQGEDLLVAFELMDCYRVGYLVVTPTPNAIAVRTFLFLTMENTPESRLLKRRLKLTRRDVDWLGLHELSAFTRTDLSDDQELYDLLDECGCAHLFELNEQDYTPVPKPFAAELRRYLRLAA